MSQILKIVDHRQFPYPESAWIMTQTWEELLFAHWEFSPSLVEPLLPAGLQLDTFEGSAWIGIVPFRMNKVRMRYLPGFPTVARFLELNVRTYVTHNGIRGVYFFSLDAESRLAVAGARTWFRLPYYFASMSLAVGSNSEEEDSLNNGCNTIHYRSTRSDRRGEPANLSCRYRSTGTNVAAKPDSLASFLTERYCLYTVSGGNILQGHVHHVPWTLETAEAEFIENSMLSPLSLQASGEPLLYYSRSLETLEWAPRTIPLH